MMNRDLDGIFRPRSVAVIGASTKKGHIGQIILHNIVSGDFKGMVFPVNPNAEVIHSIKCYDSVLDIPDPVDLAVIVVNRDRVESVVAECAEKGVKGLVVITAGYRETGPAGAEREQRLLKMVQESGMRLVGPNCFGVLNTDPTISLNATFSKRHPVSGKIGFLSQSGALGESILDYAHKLHLGFSMFASVGNKADISGNDLLAYWEHDSSTEVVLLYLENFGNPQNFIKIAQKLSKKKPLIAVKAGRTAEGARAVVSHTGALASLGAGIDALFQQCGVLRVPTVEGLFDLAAAFSNQPIPRGNRVAIVTNAGGPGILATDAMVNLGLNLAELSQATQAELRKHLDQAASVNNPIDVIASGGAAEYRAAMDAVLQDSQVDAVIVIFVPPVLIDHLAVAEAIADAVSQAKHRKTVLGCFMGAPEGVLGAEVLVRENIPLYAFPEAAAYALAAMVRYGKYQARHPGKMVSFAGDKSQVQEIIAASAENGEGLILGHDALRILHAYGIPIAELIAVASEEELRDALAEMTLPVVMKIASPKIAHKTDVKGVVLDLRSEAEVIQAFAQMREQFPDGFAGVLLQEMTQEGVETVIGMQRDEHFGPLMMFGLGGIFVEVIRDVAFKIHPLTNLDAQDMIRSVRGYPLLRGFRGKEAVNVQFIAEIILRLAQLVEDFPQFDSIDLNPFIATVSKQDARCVDARFQLKAR